MHFYYDRNNELLPDIYVNKCTNSLKIKDIDFRVPCGKCLPCQKSRRADWSLRLEHEYLFSESALFITLTYDELNVPRTKENYKTLYKKHIQLYIKRLRNEHVKYVSNKLKISKKEVKNYSRPIRYYAVGEYGTKTNRPHYHMLLFNFDMEIVDTIQSQWKNKKGYTYGHVDIGTVTASSINYVTKYMFKQFNRKTDKREPPFSLMSKKPIIGKAYLDNYGTYHIEHETLTLRDNQGKQRKLPKAYIKRLFTNKEDRLKLYEKMYDTYILEKETQIKQQLKNYKSKLDYSNSITSDINRLKTTINNKENI
jgi:hypothetical protein